MALLPTQSIDADGLAPAYVSAAGGGDTCAPSTFLHVKNGSGAPITVTLATPGKVAGLDIADRPVSVPAAGERMIRVGDEYRNPATGLCAITYSGVTTLTIGCFR
jgi:hypothetical protein